MNPKKIILLIALVLMNYSLQAAEKPEIKVRFWKSTFHKSTSNSSFGLYQLLLGFQPEPTNVDGTIHNVRIKQALDEFGSNLTQLRDTNHTLSIFPGGDSSLLRVISLQKNSTNNSQTLKTLEGEVDFYRPTIQNGGIIIITNFISQTDKLLRNPYLEKNGIKIMVLTKAMYDAKKTETLNTNDESGFTSDQINKALDDMFKFYSESPGLFPAENRLGLLIDDPKALLETISFSKANGDMVSPSIMQENPQGSIYDFNTAISVNWHLELYVSAPETIKTFSFELKDIKLK